MTDARNGIVVDRRQSGGGPSGTLGAYVVQDETDGHTYTFDYLQIVTEGFRTIRVGERVRFHVTPARPGSAEFVIRLNQPDPAEYYA
jgi:hypothetical protein